MKNKIIEKIKETRTIMNTPISDRLPQSSKNVLEGRRRSAKDSLDNLYGEHRQFVVNNAVLMLMCGEASEKVAELARTRFKCFKFDVDGFFLDLTNKVPESAYLNNGISSGAFDFLMANIEDLASKSGIKAYNFIVYKSSYNKVIKSRKELADVFKTAFIEQVGGEFLGAVAAAEAADTAFDKEKDISTYPIVLHTNDFDIAPKLISDFSSVFSKSFLISCDREKLTEETDIFITRPNKQDLNSVFDKVKKLYL